MTEEDALSVALTYFHERGGELPDEQALAQLARAVRVVDRRVKGRRFHVAGIKPRRDGRMRLVFALDVDDLNEARHRREQREARKHAETRRRVAKSA